MKKHTIAKTSDGEYWIYCPLTDERILIAKPPNFCPMCGEKTT